MFKVIRLFLLISLTIHLIGLPSCNQPVISDLTPQQPVTVQFWHYYSGEQEGVLDQQIATFEESVGKEKQIKVNAVSYGSIDHLSAQIMTAAASTTDTAQLPDLFSTYADTAWELAVVDKLVDLSLYLSTADLDVFPEAYIEEGKVTGTQQLYVAPLAKASEIVALNLTAWQAFAGDNPRYAELDVNTVFATWESIAGAAHAYHRWSGGKALIGIDSLANFIIVGNRQLGVDLFQNLQGKGRINLDREAMYRIWHIYYGSSVEGGFAAYSRFSSEDMHSGNLVAGVVSTSAGPYLKNEVAREDGTFDEIELKILPYPVFEDGEPVCVQQGAGLAVMRSESDREIAASVLLQWLTRPEQNVSFSIPAGYLPVTRPALQSQLLRDHLNTIETLYPQKPAMAASLTACLEQLDAYRLYAPPAFEHSFAARGLISHSLHSFTEEIRNEYKQNIQFGINPELLYDRYINDAMFEEWYSQLVVDVERLMQNP